MKLEKRLTVPRYKRVAPPAYMAAQPIPIITDEELAPTGPTHPADWGRGALLNVRNTGSEFVITLHPEEFDRLKPERAMRFANSSACQAFVSSWYTREARDPRAW